MYKDINTLNTHDPLWSTAWRSPNKGQNDVLHFFILTIINYHRLTFGLILLPDLHDLNSTILSEQPTIYWLLSFSYLC